MNKATNEVWNYAKLSQIAKAQGGPEQLIKTIKANGKYQGRLEMIPFILIGTIGGFYARDFYKSSRNKTEERIRKAGRALVEGINKFDASHEGEIKEQEETKENENNRSHQKSEDLVKIVCLDGRSIIGCKAEFAKDDSLKILTADGISREIGRSEIERLEAVTGDERRLYGRYMYIRSEFEKRYDLAVEDGQQCFRINNNFYVRIEANTETLCVALHYYMRRNTDERAWKVSEKHIKMDMNPKAMLRHIIWEVESCNWKNQE